jgi:hypothetical protein
VNPPIKNAMPVPGGSGPRPFTTPNAGARRNQIVLLAAFVIVLLLLVRACAGRENGYERIAHQLTQAVQNNDYAAVAKLENVETAAVMGRGRLGAAADALAPLGKIKRVKEQTPGTDPPRTHEFEVTFDKGSVHETIVFDPQDKVFHFRYDPPHTTP